MHLNRRGQGEKEVDPQIRDLPTNHLGVLREDHHLRHLRHLRLLHLLRLPMTLHRDLRKSLRFSSHQHPHIKRSPMSKHQKTSLRQRSGIVSGDRPSSTLRKIDEISTMTKRLFDSC
jgi:hypothetical protein